MPYSAKIPDVQGRWHTITSPPQPYTLHLQWHETDPMVILFCFTGKDWDQKQQPEWWRVGRMMLSLAAVNSKHIGVGIIRLGPLTVQTTMMHLILPLPREQEDVQAKRPYDEIFLSIPTKPLRHYVIETYKRVNPEQETRALDRYLDNWITRTLSNT